jgi:uncharacterized protein DUF6188
MHGLPPDVDLGFLLGKVIEQVAVGSHNVQINYRDGGISIEYKFLLKHPTLGEIEWSGTPEDAAQAVTLVAKRITGVSGKSDGTLVLRFSNGILLTIFDREEYESYSITKQGLPTIVA